MKKQSQIISGTLVASMLVTMISPHAYAAAPTVSTDETVYANLDYYGTLSNISIVKGVSLNGNTDFVDYGQYEKVTNMSNFFQPVMMGNGVQWHLGNNYNKRFYYQGTLKNNAITLPWKIDISYKLNGVPAKAEDLAGASGLVEINVKVTPNQAAPDYYKNNMLLQVATMVNMEDISSIEAPGSQLQSMGTYKAVAFAALPGEDTNFTIRIGTNSFESPGITMMMTPGTLEQLKQIKDIKEAKDTIQDAGNAIYASMNNFLGTVESMTGGLATMQSGLNGLEDARGTISSSKGGVYQNADKSLADLTLVSQQMTTLIPHLQNGQQMIKDVNSNMNTIVNTMGNAKQHLAALSESTTKIQKDIDNYRTMLNDLDNKSDERRAAFNNLSSDLTALNHNLGTVENDMDQLKTSLAGLRASLNGLNGLLGAISSGSVPGMTLDPMLIQVISNTITSLTNLTSSTENAIDGMQSSIDGGRQLGSSLRETIDLGNDYFTILENHLDDADSLLQEMNVVGDTAKKSFDLTTTLINNITALNNTLNSYKDGAVNLLNDTEELTNRLNSSMNSSVNFLSSLENLMKTSGSKMDSGTQKTLQGLIDLLNRSISGIGNVPTMRNANDTIKKTLDNEFDKYEKDNKFLNLDAEAKLMSFTSDKNPSPASVQVVLRTEEISLDKNKSNVDLEKTPQDKGVLVRFAELFKKIWQDITSTF